MGYGLNISIFTLSTFAILGFFGNSFVIFVILRKFRLQSWTYILVCHLAFCDLLSSAIGAPLWIATYTSKIFTVCKAAFFTSSLFLILSCFTLILIAYDRCVYIHYPLQYHLIVTTRKISSFLVVTWTVTLCSLVLAVTYDIDASDAVHVRYCVMSTIVNRWVLIWMFIACCLVPLLALAITYSHILRTVMFRCSRIRCFDFALRHCRVNRCYRSQHH